MKSQLHSICIQSRNFGICCYAAQEGALGPVKKGKPTSKSNAKASLSSFKVQSLTVARHQPFYYRDFRSHGSKTVETGATAEPLGTTVV